jgi:hypothetical protein
MKNFSASGQGRCDIGSENVYKLHLKHVFQVQFAQSFKNIKILLIFQKKYGTIFAL